MKLSYGVVRNGRLQHSGGPRYVDNETFNAYQSPTMTLFLREQGERFTSGTVFLFQFPPQSVRVERKAKVGVTETRHGYVVYESGLSAPRFKIDGHFGWQLREAKLSKELVPWGLKSNASIDQHMEDIWIPLPFGQERGQAGTLEKALRGEVSVLGFTQTLDGARALQRLQDFVTVYFEENTRRLSKNEKLLEMVWVDTLHHLRWVVAPQEVPSMLHSTQAQGVRTYGLELIGVYDDARPRPKKGDSLWY